MNQRVKIPGLSSTAVATLLTKRNYAYYCQSVQTLLRGECPFCQVDTSVNQIKLQTQGWMMWSVPTQLRAKHLKDHVLIVPKRHVLHPTQLLPAEWNELYYVMNETWDRYQPDGGGIVMRFGDPALNAGSVEHLHMNIIVPDGTGAYRTPFAKEPEETEEAWQRMAVYEKIRQGTTMENLNQEERALVEGRMC